MQIYYINRPARKRSAAIICKRSRNGEFNADYKISLQGNNLALQVGENLEAPLTAAYADFFTAAGGQINLSFTRGDKGKIAGFVFNSAADGREVKGIAFKRQ